VAAGSEFCLLGPLQVSRGGEEVTIPPGKQRVLLAALLLNAGRTVPVAELVEALWGATPPASARVTVQNYVKRLRQALGDADQDRIVTRPGGYLISVAADELDVSQFQALLSSARAAGEQGSWQVAADRASAALALWRGEPLADVRSELLAARELPWLGELRRQALETRIEAELHLGRHGDVIGELRQLAAADPLRERLHALLMLALYRDGRRGEALAAYQDARRVLVAELGAEPGAGLADVHQRILSADSAMADPLLGSQTLTSPFPTDPAPFAPSPASSPASPAPSAPSPASSPASPAPSAPSPASSPASPAPSAPSPAPSAPSPALPPADPELAPPADVLVPRQLPAPVAYFVGRAAELTALTALLDQSAGPAGAVMIAAIGGTAGVGKTALAVCWAHQVASRFPDGQLYANLRGYDPGQPASAADVLAAFLRALGVSGLDIPADLEERAARYRSLLSGRRVLVVLDNAASVQQVRPLLPGSWECMVIVTSRDTLAGLVARDGAARLDLEPLPMADAVGLLETLIGERVTANPGAATALAQRCCRLPLALRVAAELAAARPGVSLAALADELENLQRRLDLLEAGGDPRTAARAVFSWSYRCLDAEAARAFRLAGLHPGPDLDSYSVAALADVAVERSASVLEVLARAHLVQASGSGRVGMHELLRAYAAELAGRQDNGQDRRAALTRLFDYYLQTTAAAMDSLYPAERSRRPRIQAAGTPAPTVADPAAARAWLDAERANLVAVAGYTAGHGWPGHTTRLATTLFRYLNTGNHYSEAIALNTHALHAARELGDHSAEAAALNSLGVFDVRQGRYQQATERLSQALDLCRIAGDQAGQARALGNLGGVAIEQGRYQQAADHLTQGLAMFREIGDEASEARQLHTLGIAYERQGRYELAAEHNRQALAVHRRIGDRPGEVYALNGLGSAYLRLGDTRQAAGCQREALALSIQIGDRAAQAYILTDLADVELRQGLCQQAAGHHQQSLMLCRDLGERVGEAQALNGLGEVMSAAGQPEYAQAQHTAALTVAGQIGDQHQQARAYEGLARAHHAAGDGDQARPFWQRALALYTDLGTPEADAVRAQLATVAGRGRGEP
jgi:DNA-binding SARP family transcriptional activator/Tfp pilus assembly protein PilF